MMPMRIRSLVTCGAHNRPLLTLVDRDGRQWQLTLWLPGNEAERLGRVLGLLGHRCVAVFDLVLALLQEFGGRLLAVVLDADHEGVGAQLRLDRGGTEVLVPCHPADALALAERVGAPIYATSATLRYARPLSTDSGGDVAGWLQRVRPDDFGARG